MTSRSRPWLAAVLTLGMTGCTGGLPAYRWVDHDTAMRDIAARADRVETLTAQCRIILRDADGASTQLDGVIATRRPGKLRVRGWKLSQPAFDLTITGDSVWVYDGRSEDEKASAVPADDGFVWLADAFEALGGIVVIRPTAGAVPVDRPFRSEHRIRRKLRTGGGVLTCGIDRRTLTFTQCTVRDADGTEMASIAFDRYRVTDGVVYPGRIDARAGGRRVTVLLDEVDINPELPASAFTPPGRATRKR